MEATSETVRGCTAVVGWGFHHKLFALFDSFNTEVHVQFS